MRLFTALIVFVLLFSCGKREVRQVIPESDQPSELLRYGDQFYAEADYESAFIAYGTVVNNFPTSREYIDASIGLSRCYGNFEDYEKEFDILYELLRENLIPTKVPLIYNAIAEFYERSAGISEQLTGAGSSDYQTAIGYYQKAIDYPNSDDADAKGFANYKIGALYSLLDDPKNAVVSFQATMSLYSGSEWATRSEQELLELEERERRRAEYEGREWVRPEAPSEEPAQTETESMEAPALESPGEQLPDSSTVVPDSSEIEP